MVKSYSKRIFDLIMKPEMKVLPGQLAYFLILSIFPLLTLIGFIISKITLLSTPFISVIQGIFPSNITNIFLPFITDNNFSGNALIMIIGFILVSNGTHSIIVTSDEVYGIDSGSYINRRIKALFMILILLILFVFVLIVLVYGNTIIGHIINMDMFNNIRGKIYFVYVLLKWPLSFVILFWILKLLYTIAPDAQISSRFMNKGAFFTTVGWIITTFVYSYYVSNIADYSLFYGSLSGIIIMMIWIYILSFIFVMGIAINAEDYLVYKDKHKRRKTVNNN